MSILNTLISIISFGIVILIGFRKTKRSINEVFKFNKVSAFFWIAITVFMTGFVIVISETDNLLNYILPMPEFFRNIFETISVEYIFILAIINMGIIPPITEELFFRGLILDGLKNNYSKRKAIIISALLFGLIHLNPWQAYGAFIMGLIFAWICIETNSILLSIYMHFFNNTLYTITLKYKELIPIKGFNVNFITPVEFQPLWFDLSGLIILIIGTIMLIKGIKRLKQAPDRLQQQ
ncbi:MAG: CPBP family intramembrane metalloprotease [Spirochaetes bacterium]|nr:CPBP family intramembrane metalloprotease [Spirochaetota bacterium]